MRAERHESYHLLLGPSIVSVSDELQTSMGAHLERHVGLIEAGKLTNAAYLRLMRDGIDVAKELLHQEGVITPAQEFNIRGFLYDLAFQVAPHAREDELAELIKRMGLREGDKVVDLMSGTGFVSTRVPEITHWGVYAVDSSYVQLALQLLRTGPPYPHKNKVWLVKADPSCPELTEKITEGEIDVADSLGGLHHVPNQRQRCLFANVARLLKVGGRFVFGDVTDMEAGLPLVRHFEHTSSRCVTGHVGYWLNEKRLREEILPGLPLRILSIEVVPTRWHFDSLEQITLFFMGLHALDADITTQNLQDNVILDEIREFLGIERIGDTYFVGWPLMYAELERVHGEVPKGI
ncbi:MAG: class I SAM-dependent methyltransferase [Candidatus Blackburnbacteria bacterium]|nr:class I SAM-dependent methyltransferase [Candidatus Blackburnbacteria bacterium]